MKIYTRTGDGGQTGLIGGRTDKDDLRVETYGTVDELNGFIGLAAASIPNGKFADMKERLMQIQHALFDCGHDLALARPDGRKFRVREDMVHQLEAWIDAYEREVPPLARFILPGGNLLASHLHVCRSVCRRAERRVVSLSKREPLNPQLLPFFNRLSDLFFMMARTANFREGVSDVEYIPGNEGFKQR